MKTATDVGLQTWEADVTCGVWCQGGSVRWLKTDHPQYTDASDVWVRGDDAIAALESLRAELAACRAAAVYLFNCGYMRGHHDTVEACFVDIHDSDMRTYQSDVVAEVIDEALTARKGEGDG